MAAKARFRTFAESTAEDWRLIVDPASALEPDFPERVLAQMRALAADTGGMPVTRLEHSLQTATRAHRAGEAEEYVVCALLHDIGDLLCPTNHADMAAAMLHPYVSDENHWVLAHHTVFQGYYYFHHLGLDRNMRDAWRGHQHFAATEAFCRLYDQVSFDAGFDSMPLAAFEPMLRRVLERPKRSIFAPDIEAAPQGGRRRAWAPWRRR